MIATCLAKYRENIMASKKSSWVKFPHDQKTYDFSGDKLKKAWAALHSGDGEPYPDDKRAAVLIKAAGKLAPKALSAEDLASQLQQAWAAYHHGDFQQAFELSEALGPVGASVACKALGIHSTYLVDDEAEQLGLQDLDEELRRVGDRQHVLQQRLADSDGEAADDGATARASAL